MKYDAIAVLKLVGKIASVLGEIAFRNHSV